MGFQFFAINDLSINAFAMPGGFIGVHVGLLLAVQTESELAGVLAHEVSHVTQRHIARQIFQSKKLSMASMVAMGLSLLAARSSPQGAMAAISTTQAGAIAAQLAYSRDFEREADRLGFDILRRAGYDVRGMSGFFARLQQSTRQYENNATAYLRTHPLSGERMSDMQNREQPVAYRQVADSQDFQLVRARVRALQGRPSDAVREFETFLRDRLAMLDKALGTKDYLEGRFTVGDLMMADVLRILDHTAILDEYPALKRYKERCAARPGFKRAMADQMHGFAEAA